MMMNIPVLSISLCTSFLKWPIFRHVLVCSFTYQSKGSGKETRKAQTNCHLKDTNSDWMVGETDDTTFSWSVGEMPSLRLLNPYLGTYINCLLLEVLSICHTNWSHSGLSSLARDRQCNLGTWIHSIVGSSLSVRQQISSFLSTLFPAENIWFCCGCSG